MLKKRQGRGRSEPDVALEAISSQGSDLEIHQQIQQFLALVTYREAPEMLIMLINVDNVDNSSSRKIWGVRAAFRSERSRM